MRRRDVRVRALQAVTLSHPSVAVLVPRNVGRATVCRHGHSQAAPVPVHTSPRHDDQQPCFLCMDMGQGLHDPPKCRVPLPA